MQFVTRHWIAVSVGSALALIVGVFCLMVAATYSGHAERPVFTGAAVWVHPPKAKH